MDVRFINPFIAATQKVFSVMVNTPVTMKRAMAARELPKRPGTISAIVELHGEVEGVVLLRFPMAVASGVATAFAQTSVDEDDIQDAIGELANMVAGNAKQNLYGRFATLSIPTVSGEDLPDFPAAKNAPWLVIAMSSGVGDFEVLVRLSMSRALSAV